MNLTKFFTKEGNIAGLHIASDVLRLVLISNRKKNGPEIRFYLEEPLAPGDVAGGRVMNADGFRKSLDNLLRRAKPRIHYAVVTLPADLLYSKVYSFPASVSGERLDNALELIANFQLPKKPEEAYLDWQKFSTEEKNQALVSMIEKPAIDEIVGILDKAGLQAIAIECHQMSLARVIADGEPGPILIIEKGEAATVVSIIKDKNVFFIRSLPDRLAQNGLAAEVEKIINFYELEDGPVASLLTVGALPEEELRKLPLKPAVSKIIPLAGSDVISRDSTWFSALGAAWRGLIPRAEDKLISLMKIGTEEAYEQKKASTFSNFLTYLAITLALFFVAAFAASWLMMIKVRENFNEQIQSRAAMENASSFDELSARAATLNELVGKAGEIARIEARWSGVLEELESRVTSGIQLNSLVLAGPNSPINVAGVAENRNQLAAFKKTLEESAFFSNVVLPDIVVPLSKKTTIPFTVSFNIRNPESLMLK